MEIAQANWSWIPYCWDTNAGLGYDTEKQEVERHSCSLREELHLGNLSKSFDGYQTEDAGKGSVSDLNYKFILCEVLPPRDVTLEVIPCDEPFVANLRESVYCMSSLYACSEEPCEEHNWQETVSESHDKLPVSCMISHVL